MESVSSSHGCGPAGGHRGAVGEIVSIQADYGELLYPNGLPRLADPALAGGALLDLGIYPVSFAHLVLGGFDNVTAVGTLIETGVDSSETITAVRGTALATLSSTMLGWTPGRASITGTRGRIDIDSWFYRPSTVRLVSNTGIELAFYDPPTRHHGLAYEAAEFARLLTGGKQESELLPLTETVRIMQVLDEVRAQLGVRFPGE